MPVELSATAKESVADATAPKAGRHRHPTVRLLGGDDSSGMATMLAGLLEDNVRDFPMRGRVASVARGDVVLRASDRDLAVTLSFGPGEVTVADGAAPGAPVLAGPWMEMTRLCSGQASPVAAIARGDVKVVRGRRMAVVPAVSFVCSVPASFYGDTSQRRRRLVVAAAAVVVVGMVLAARGGSRRQRERGDG